MLELGVRGVDAGRLAAEVLVPVLAGGKLDLVVDPPAGTVVEFKHPRDSRTGFSPDTMTFGELVRDFLRVAAVSATERWVVQVLNDRLLRYLIRVCRRHGFRWVDEPGTTLELHPAALAALPKTETQAIGAAAATATVTARCVVAERVVGTNRTAVIRLSPSARLTCSPPSDRRGHSAEARFAVGRAFVMLVGG